MPGIRQSPAGGGKGVTEWAVGGQGEPSSSRSRRLGEAARGTRLA